MMSRITQIIVGLLFLALFFTPMKALAMDIPEINSCHMISLRTSNGWWLQVHRDNSAEYGFGTMIDRVRVRRNSLVFEEVYETAKKNLLDRRRDAEAPYVAAAFYKTGENAAREYYLENPEWAGGLFHLARDNSLEPGNDWETSWREKIDGFWAKSPPALSRGKVEQTENSR